MPQYYVQYVGFLRALRKIRRVARLKGRLERSAARLVDAEKRHHARLARERKVRRIRRGI